MKNEPLEYYFEPSGVLVNGTVTLNHLGINPELCDIFTSQEFVEKYGRVEWSNLGFPILPKKTYGESNQRIQRLVDTLNENDFGKGTANIPDEEDLVLSDSDKLVEFEVLKPGISYKRSEIREAIVSYFLKGGDGETKKMSDLNQENEPTSSESPSILFTAGGAGAGKSTVLKMLIENGEDIVPKKAVTIGADLIKELLPEYKLLVENHDYRAASVVHAESQNIAMRLLAESKARKLNVVFDSTMADLDSKMDTIIGFEEAGYTASMVGVSVDPYAAVVRNYKRFMATGRMIPAISQLQGHKSVNQNLMVYEAYLRDANAVYESPVIHGESIRRVNDRHILTRAAHLDERGGLDTDAPNAEALVKSYGGKVRYITSDEESSKPKGISFFTVVKIPKPMPAAHPCTAGKRNRERVSALQRS